MQLVIVVGLIGLIFIGYWVQLERSFQDSRKVAFAAAELRAEQTVKALRLEMEATLRAVDFIITATTAAHLDELENFQTAAGRAFSILPEQSGAVVSLYDLHGILVASSGPAAPDISAAPVFEAARRDAGRLAIGTPRRDPATGRSELTFLRAIRRGDAPAGFMAATLSMAVFTRELVAVGLKGADFARIIVLPEGLILAGVPEDTGPAGSTVAADQPFMAADAPDEGVLSQTGPRGERNIVAWARHAQFPLVATVFLSGENVLRDLEDNIAQSRWIAQVNALFLLALIAVVIILILRGARQRRILVRQEGLYHALFEQNKSIKLISDPGTGDIVEANQAACDFYGYSRDQLLGMKISEINCLPPPDIVRHMREALARKVPFFLFPHRLASGEIRQVEVYSGPVELGGRTVLYSIVHDVTGRFRLEARLRESEARYRTVFETVPDGLILVDGAQNIVATNAAAEKILGCDTASILARRPPAFLPSGQPIADNERPSRRALSEDIHGELFFLRDAEGGKTWVTVNSRRLPPAPDGAPSGAVVTFSDITRLVQQEERLRISQLVFDATTEGIMVTDAAARIVAVNRAFTEITGYRADEVAGHRPNFLRSGLHEPAFYRAMFESLASKRSWEGEITNRHKSGRHFIERLVINAVVGTDGAVSAYVAVLSDITGRKEKEQHLWHQANFDALTGLPNRTLFLDRAEQALVQSRRRNQPVAVLFVDLDRFKPVNDQHGHAVGDDLLRAVARRIAGCVRAEDTVARIGGDEFVVLLPAVGGLADARAVGEKILHAISTPFVVDGRSIAIGACVGVALGPEGRPSAAHLLKAADAAMYRAKEAGRGRVELSA